MNLKQIADDMIGAVREYVTRTLGPFEARLAAIEARPTPQDGKSVTVEDVRPLVEDFLRAWPVPKDGTSVTVEDCWPAIETYLKTIPVPKDGTSVSLEDVLPHVDEFLQGLPVPKDGENGTSVSLDDARKMWSDAYASQQAAWALDFERRAQDVLQRAVERIPKPRDGNDGLAVEDFEFTMDGRTATVMLMRGGEVLKTASWRTAQILDAGVYRDGALYEKGDAVSFGGSLWIAQKDAPQGKPGTSPDWRLAVKKGRDGADATKTARADRFDIGRADR